VDPVRDGDGVLGRDSGVSGHGRSSGEYPSKVGGVCFGTPSGTPIKFFDRLC